MRWVRYSIARSIRLSYFSVRVINPNDKLGKALTTDLMSKNKSPESCPSPSNRMENKLPFTDVTSTCKRVFQWWMIQVLLSRQPVWDLNVRSQERGASTYSWPLVALQESAGKRRSLRVRHARWSVEPWQWERGRRKSGSDEWRESEPLITVLTPRPQASSRVCGLCKSHHSLLELESTQVCFTVSTTNTF